MLSVTRAIGQASQKLHEGIGRKAVTAFVAGTLAIGILLPVASPVLATTPANGSTYFPVAAKRVVDTRLGANGLPLVGNTPKPVIGGSAVSFQVTGYTGAAAVTGYLTVVNPQSKGYLTIGGNYTAVNGKAISSLNFPTSGDGQNYSIGVTTDVAAGGWLYVAYGGSTAGAKADFIFDITGYFMATGGSTYHTAKASRVVDTRSGLGTSMKPKIGGPVVGFQVLAVPTNATAVTGYLTVTNPGVAGYLTIGGDYNAVGARSYSSLNFPSVGTYSIAVTTDISSGRWLYVAYGGPTPGKTTDFIFDITGYFAPGGYANYYAVTPARVVDTRSGTPAKPVLTAPDDPTKMPVAFQVAGKKGVPLDAVAVSGYLTVTNPAVKGYLTIGGDHAALFDLAYSSLSIPTPGTYSIGVTVDLGPGGVLYVAYGGPTPGKTTDFIFDVTGYFEPTSEPGAISLTQANALFANVKAATTYPTAKPAASSAAIGNFIEWRYPNDGCWARAYIMLRLMQSLQPGATLGRAWALDPENNANKNGGLPAGNYYTPIDAMTLSYGTVSFASGWHVAPTVKVAGWGTMVFDPAMFTGPVTLETWASRMSNIAREDRGATKYPLSAPPYHSDSTGYPRAVFLTSIGQANPVTRSGSGYTLSGDPSANLDRYSQHYMCEYHNNAVDLGRYASEGLSRISDCGPTYAS